MQLVLKRAADAFPDVNWPRSDEDWAVFFGTHPVCGIRKVVGGPAPINVRGA